MNKKELIDIAERLVELCEETGERMGKCLAQLIADTSTTSWHNYPEVKPEKDGEYLVKSLPKHSYEYLEKDYFSHEYGFEKHGDNVIAFCEIPE